MRKSLSRVMVSAAVLLGGVLVAPLATTPAAQANVFDCIDHAVNSGATNQQAAAACEKPTTDECYQAFRAAHGAQSWAQDACERGRED
ncbi:hypothetical protein HUO13_17785 [Saccharopolyspora erythraea]|uniref:hypothetical protein n=1 Tax=Saccharopolyspora erythraea TaxID=1836 RepID=UPI001BAB944E|nr:hypothetical protein [Saccharopolyspora erythraea]QUH02406.1 hypothetical protein HUO13_17785 [Saccharopolyspora erythraea]